LSIDGSTDRLAAERSKGATMKYLLLLYGDADGEAALTDDERRAIVEAHLALGRRLAEHGVLVEAEALGPPAAAVRLEGGKRNVTDGPFAETKEQLGSFYLLDCRDLDDAIAYAKEIPESPGLNVQVVPVL
jgi:hypothetical protein